MKEKKEARIDYGIILSVMLLAIISILTLFSTSYVMAGSSLRMTIMQIAWYVVGAIAVVIIMQFDSEQLWKLAPYAYATGILLLILVLLFYDRPLYLSTGGKSWFRIAGLTFQPSELVKIAFIIMLARVVTQHNSDYANHDVRSDFILLGKIALTSLPPMILVQLQGDLGTNLVFISIVIGITLMSGVTWKILLPLFGSVAGLGASLLLLVVYNRDFLLKLGFKTYQFKRVDSWLNPYHDTQDAAYQLMQSIKAIGSGKVFGKGFGVSEVYVPVRESDMIFATIGENFGFIGGAILIFIYFMLIYQMIRVCFDTKNIFYTYIATGVIMMILFHVFENVGMSIGLLPLTGIPLPFISQGGSALLGNMMGIGLIMSMRYHHRSYVFSKDEDFR
ncbi:FtsW/RodA/SpoVE family cell cycle protein [Pisciglobus halotolerans]|uniref:Rod shape determining protein RodA n=1 Tax=Pisciglobus halotolerans TaxID=745365 RepID=A0A1I3BRT9_9LACT|nr:FtsW/RodA/SpoVE family cell cycle protein [Pisciglobus halotolerans]SFH65028.1 rod shape determining protein RodA [Pisciglobus halotolerans]